jgi:acyl-CoA thioesterase
MLFSEILTTITQRSDGEGLTAEISPDWTQGRACFGGLVAALGNEALRRLVPAERPLRGLDVTFVAPAMPGRVQMQAEVLRAGKSVTIAHSRVVSSGQVAATLTGIYGAARPSVLTVAPTPPPRASPAEEWPASQIPMFPHFAHHFDVRWIEGCSRPFVGSGLTHSKAYVRHRDPTPLSETALVGLLDCIWTPSLQMLGAVTPSSSLNWRLEFLRHDYNFAPQAWWRIDTQTNAATEGYISHSSVVLDPDGKLAAYSHQLVVVFG